MNVIFNRRDGWNYKKREENVIVDNITLDFSESEEEDENEKEGESSNDVNSRVKWIPRTPVVVPLPPLTPPPLFVQPLEVDSITFPNEPKQSFHFSQVPSTSHSYSSNLQNNRNNLDNFIKSQQNQRNINNILKRPSDIKMFVEPIDVMISDDVDNNNKRFKYLQMNRDDDVGDGVGGGYGIFEESQRSIIRSDGNVMNSTFHSLPDQRRRREYYYGEEIQETQRLFDEIDNENLFDFDFPIF